MRFRVLIDEARCKACELCVVVCPTKVLGMSYALNRKGLRPAEVVKPEACTGCRSCALMCPDVAIQIDREAPDAAKRSNASEVR